MAEHVTYTTFDQLPLMLTVEEVGAVLRIGRNSAYTLVRSGQLKSIRIGKQLRIPRNAVEEFLHSLS